MGGKKPPNSGTFCPYYSYFRIPKDIYVFFVWVERLSNKGGPDFYVPWEFLWCMTLEVLTAALDRHKDRPDAVIAVPGIRRRKGPGQPWMDGFFVFFSSSDRENWIPKFC